MKKLTKEYSAKTSVELKKEIDVIRLEMAKLEIEKTVKPGKDSNAIQKMKKRIAVMQTIIRQQELGIQK
ncbi:50S ribosomal protein L29 [Candidatus Woesebacteria bacterium]|nr:50S ribosomal protein L29 [Candidatus Woesebacteria bacterium]